MLKKQETIKTNKEKKSVTFPGSLPAIFLILINLYLLYNLSLTLLPLMTKSAKLSQSDSLKSNIQVEVLNGCGVTGIADKLSDYLRRNSFDVVNLGNYRSFEVETSIIIDRTGNIINAKQIAFVLGLSDKNIISQINKEYLLDVTFILGTDYLTLTPLKKRS